MNLFSKSAAPERELTVEEARANRESELLAEITKLTEQRDTLRHLVEVFRSEHMILIGNQIAFAVSDPALLDSLRSQWSTLTCEAARVAQERDKALAAWSELHSNRETVTHGHPW